MVTPSYFQTLRIKVLKGRALNDQDKAGAPPAMVVNETLAKHEFPKDDPIGQRILVQQIVPGQTALGSEIPWEIVGVIADEKINSLSDETSGGMYVSTAQSPVYLINMVVRAAIDPRSLETAVRNAVASVNADQAVSNVRTLEQITDQSLVANRVQSLLLGIFAGVALLLAAIGIYGVIAYAVTQRTHELGIRGALGASGPELRALVFRGGMRLALIGLAIGLGGALDARAAAVLVALRRERARSAHARGRDGHARRHRGRRVLLAGAARDQGQPDRRVALSVKGRTGPVRGATSPPASSQRLGVGYNGGQQRLGAHGDARRSGSGSRWRSSRRPSGSPCSRVTRHYYLASAPPAPLPAWALGVGAALPSTSTTPAGPFALAPPLSLPPVASASPPGNDPAAISQRADAAFTGGNYAEAAALYDQLLAIDPQNVELYNNLGLTLHYLGKSDRSASEARGRAQDRSEASTQLAHHRLREPAARQRGRSARGADESARRRRRQTDPRLRGEDARGTTLSHDRTDQ